MDTDATYFWICAICFVVYIYLDVKDYSVLLKIKSYKKRKGQYEVTEEHD